MLKYHIEAESYKDGKAKVSKETEKIVFNAKSKGGEEAIGPAELLLFSLGACMLKNVDRFSEMLKFDYKRAEIEVFGERNESPPYMKTITYTLKIESDMDLNKLDLLHRNILKFGTITNTIARACELKGEIELIKLTS